MERKHPRTEVGEEGKGWISAAVKLSKILGTGRPSRAGRASAPTAPGRHLAVPADPRAAASPLASAFAAWSTPRTRKQMQRQEKRARIPLGAHASSPTAWFFSSPQALKLPHLISSPSDLWFVSLAPVAFSGAAPVLCVPGLCLAATHQGCKSYSTPIYPLFPALVTLRVPVSFLIRVINKVLTGFPRIRLCCLCSPRCGRGHISSDVIPGSKRLPWLLSVPTCPLSPLTSALGCILLHLWV